MELKLIGLYGPSRAGKDSVAYFLHQDFGFTQKAMADGIRQILLGLNPILKDNGGVVWELLDLFDACHGDWDIVKARASESVDYMINLGQACRDVLGEQVWLERVIKDFDGDNSICISDVRQPNEYHAIKELGGQVWKISRPGVVKRGMDGLLEGLDFDATIDNRGSLADLRGIVQATIANDINIREYRKNYGVRF